MPSYEDTEFTPNLELIEEEKERAENMNQLIQQQTVEQQILNEGGSIPEPPQEEPQEGMKDIYGNPWPPQMDEQYYEESRQIGQDIVTGVGDTILGVGSMAEKAILRGQEGPITSLKILYEEQFPTITPLRKLSGLLIPMLYGGAVAQSAVKGSAFISQLPRWKQIGASLAAEVGTESIILAGSTSATDDN